MDQRDRDIYMSTAEVADFARWLFEGGHLRTESREEAQQLGERYFEESAEQGWIAKDWRDKAHVNIFRLVRSAGVRHSEIWAPGSRIRDPDVRVDRRPDRLLRRQHDDRLLVGHVLSEREVLALGLGREALVDAGSWHVPGKGGEARRDAVDDLWANVAAHMWACRFGIAFFEARTERGLNYNLNIEVGSCLVLGCRLALLKDVSLEAMPTDLVGRIYRTVDLDDPGTVEYELEDWITETLRVADSW